MLNFSKPQYTITFCLFIIYTFYISINRNIAILLRVRYYSKFIDLEQTSLGINASYVHIVTNQFCANNRIDVIIA